jgi:hypothetical protein
MRTVIIGAVTGTCFCVLVVAACGAIAGYSDPDGFPPGLMPGLPRTVLGCFYGVYFGVLAAPAGALVGGIVGGVGTVISWSVTKNVRQKTAVQRGSVERGNES